MPARDENLDLMVVYTAHVPAGTASRSDRDADKVVFVKDGFAWSALIFSFLWLLFNRCWIAALAVLAVSVGLSAVGEFYPRLTDAVGMVGFLFSLLVALEANNWRRWSLSRKGYQELGPVTGSNRAECERRFFENWISGSAAVTAAPVPRPSVPAKMSVTPGIVGMFPERGR